MIISICFTHKLVFKKYTIGFMFNIVSVARHYTVMENSHIHDENSALDKCFFKKVFTKLSFVVIHIKLIYLHSKLLIRFIPHHTIL